MAQDADDAVVEGPLTKRIRSILSPLDGMDGELVEPPADVWAGIEAALISDPPPSPKEPPARSLGTGTLVEYWIDANDVVIDVGQDWASFARDNDAPDLVAVPSDRTLWTFFDTDEVRDLWRLLVARVRALQKPAQVPLRCDAPAARRWFQMTITPGANDGVHFRCTLVFEESRSPVRLLDPHSDRDPELPPVALCAWCGRGELGSRWVDVEELVRAARLLERASMPPISQGICASCRDEMAAELLVGGQVDESPT